MCRRSRAPTRRAVPRTAGRAPSNSGASVRRRARPQFRARSARLCATTGVPECRLQPALRRSRELTFRAFRLSVPAQNDSDLLANGGPAPVRQPVLARSDTLRGEWGPGRSPRLRHRASRERRDAECSVAWRRWRAPQRSGKGLGSSQAQRRAPGGQSRASASRKMPSKEACASAGSRCNCSSAARTCASRKPRLRNAEKTLTRTSSVRGVTLRPYSVPSACRTRRAPASFRVSAALSGVAAPT